MRLIVVIWSLLGPAVQAAIVGLMARRRLYRKGMFPFFFTYTLYSIFATLLRLLLNRQTQFPMFYWSTEVIYGVLAILSLNEVFSRTFRLDYEDYPWLRFAFPSVVVVITIGLIIWWRFFYQLPNGRHLGLPASAFVGFNEGVHSIESILLGLFLLLWFVFSPGWNRYDHGILVGFGLSGLITMTADMIRFQTGLSHWQQLWYEQAPGIAYIIVTAIWLHALWPKYEPQPKPLSQFGAMLEHTNRSNEVIRVIYDWLRRGRP